MKLSAHPLSSPDIKKGLAHVQRDGFLAARLRASFSIMAQQGDALATEFYKRLFSAQPQLRPMFPTDLTAQKQKLIDSLDFVVKTLDHPEGVRDALKEMGKRHVGYGAKPEHYPIVREHLVAAMAAVSGSNWSGALRDDWNLAIDMIGAVMRDGVS